MENSARREHMQIYMRICKLVLFGSKKLIFFLHLFKQRERMRTNSDFVWFDFCQLLHFMNTYSVDCCCGQAICIWTYIFFII